MSGDLVGDDDIDSSPTFELIVDGEDAREEVSVECQSAATVTSLAAHAAVTTTMSFGNKRQRMSEVNAADVVPVSECAAASVLVTGLSHAMYVFLLNGCQAV